MTGMDAVEKQVEAFNARDVDAFVACYARDAVIEDADGGVQMSGRDEIRKSYGELFETRPNLRAEIPSRIRVGSYVVDEEQVSGLTDADFDAIAITRSTTTASSFGPAFVADSATPRVPRRASSALATSRSAARTGSEGASGLWRMRGRIPLSASR